MLETSNSTTTEKKRELSNIEEKAPLTSENLSSDFSPEKVEKELKAFKNFVESYWQKWIEQREEIISRAKKKHVCMSIPNEKEEKQKHISSSCEKTTSNTGKNLDWMNLGRHYMGYTPFNKDIEISSVDYDHMSNKEFYEKYVSKRRPCKLNVREYGNNSLSVTMTKLANIEYLKRVAGHILVHAEKKETTENKFGRGIKKKMRFSTFLNKIIKGDENLYLTTQNIPESDFGPINDSGDLLLKTELSFTFPQQPAILTSLVPHQYNLWIGCSKTGTSSGLHHDYHDNLYLVLKGKKKFRLFSPNLSEALNIDKSKIKVIYPNGLIAYDSYIREDGADKEHIAHDILKKTKAEICNIEIKIKKVADQILDSIDYFERSSLPEDFRMDKFVRYEKPKPKIPIQVILSEANSKKDEIIQLQNDLKLATEREISCREEYEEICKLKEMENANWEKEKSKYVKQDYEISKRIKVSAHPYPKSSLEYLEFHLNDKQKKKLKLKKEKINEIQGKQKTPVMDSDDSTDIVSYDFDEIDDNFTNSTSYPNNFVDRDIPLNAISKLTPETTINDITESNVLDYFLEVTLKAGEVLYLPAGWYHDVISINNDSNDEEEPSYHMALNHWFYPPIINGNIENPYLDDFWKNLYAERISRRNYFTNVQSARYGRTTPLHQFPASLVSRIKKIDLSINSKKKKKKVLNSLSDNKLFEQYQKHKQLRSRI